MTIGKIEAEESSTIESLDLCCLEFVNGDNSMQDACMSMDIEVGEELIWNDSICRIKTEIQTNFMLPDAMTIVKTET